MKTMNPISAPRSGKIHEDLRDRLHNRRVGQTLLIIA